MVALAVSVAMTNEQLCALALAAIDDEDARVVLADALEESGWWDERIDRVVLPPWPVDRPRILVNLQDGWGSPAYAIAAALLFGEWPTSWPLAERCPRRSENYLRVRAEFDRIRQQQVDYQIQRAREEWQRIHGWP